MPSGNMTRSWSRTQSWGKAEVSTARQDVKRVTCLMCSGYWRATDNYERWIPGKHDRMILVVAVAVRCKGLSEALKAGSQVNVLRPAGSPMRSERMHGPVD
jgi:hypothetical protein